MPLPFAVLLTVLLFAGLSMLFAGLHIRRGDRPRCASCSYDLSALIPDDCPECNEDLSEPRGIVRGDRRPFLAGFGLVVVLLSVVGFGIGFLGGATLDQRKPVWLLDVELSLVNEQGEERIKEELRRRLFDTATGIGEKHAIADLALRRARTAYSEPMSLLLADCAMSGVVDAEKADPYMRELIALWSSDWLLTEEGESRSIELRALIESCGIELEALSRIISEASALGIRVSPHDRTPSQEHIIQSCELLLMNWWRSPSSPGELTDNYLRTLFKDAPVAKLTARPAINAQFGKLPYRLEYAYPPVQMADGEAVRLSCSIESVRVNQGNQIVYEQTQSQGGFSRTHHHAFRLLSTWGAMGTGILVEGIEAGPGNIEVVLKFSIDRGDGDVVLERSVTVEDSFEAVRSGEDKIALVSSELAGVTPSQLLEWFHFTDLYYSTPDPFGSQGPWSFGYGRSDVWRVDLIPHDKPTPEFHAAWRVLANQGDTEWDIGTIRLFDVLSLRRSFFQTVVPTRTPMRTSESGSSEWATLRPDFNRPVRLRLEPDPDLARLSVDIHEIFGEPIELGNFMIVQTDQFMRAQNDGEKLKPAPILSE
ncbi:MAG: hypothetical protein ED559_03290 [Phycisphaera sp.]|nr:MAG: hypothetical protein ED559_03290 [Phycisphaera sp.]